MLNNPRRRMSSSSKTIRFLVSYEFLLSLLATFVLTVAALLFFYKFNFWAILNLVPSKVLIGLIFLNRVFGFLYELKDRKLYALFSMGILIIISGLIFNYAYRFKGIVSLGEGESFADFDLVERGPLSKPPEFAITVEEIEGDPLKSDKPARVKLRNGRKLIVLSPGRHVAGFSLLTPHFSLIKVDPAPRFLISDRAGRELHSAFVKLNLLPVGKEDYFRSPAVPHRFYVRLTGNEDKPFNIRICRGKLKITEKDMAVGEEMEFEGLKFSFSSVSKWGEIEISHYPGNKIVFTGIAVIIAGIIIRRRKKHAA